MEKNSLKYTGLLAFIVWGALLLMHLLPSITMGGRVLRRVDILGDVRRPSKPVSEPDSLLPPPPKVKPAFVDTCRAGMTCIEDYSDSTMRGMTRFYQALDELAKAPRPVRIAYFGDSFIEADILTADLREMLQQKYGGCGVGFVTITSMTSGFRPTVRHSFSGWQSHSVMDSVFFDRSKLESPDITLFRIPMLMWNCGVRRTMLPVWTPASVPVSFSITVAQPPFLSASIVAKQLPRLLSRLMICRR